MAMVVTRVRVGMAAVVGVRMCRHCCVVGIAGAITEGKSVHGGAHGGGFSHAVLCMVAQVVDVVRLVPDVPSIPHG